MMGRSNSKTSYEVTDTALSNTEVRGIITIWYVTALRRTGSSAKALESVRQKARALAEDARVFEISEYARRTADQRRVITGPKLKEQIPE
jgi:hypothetical protein